MRNEQMKLPFFIVVIISPFMVLKSMDISHPEYLLLYRKEVALYNQRKINEFDADCKAMWQQKLSMGQFMDNISRLTATYEQVAPFFMIDDCAKESCILARCNNPNFRKVFERRASLALQEKITDYPDRPINYTSFCPSGTLSELIILAQTLQQHPKAHINIHLIEKGYKESIDARKAMGCTLNIGPEQHLFLDERDISFYLRNLPLSCDFNEKRRLFISILFAETLYRQFISYLTNTFWNAKLSLYFYQSIDEYLYHSPFAADVLTTVDIANEDYDSHSYGLLCLATLQANPESTNIALDDLLIDEDENTHDNTQTSEQHVGPCLFSYSTKQIIGKPKQQTKTNIVDHNNTEHTLYVSYKKFNRFARKTRR